MYSNIVFDTNVLVSYLTGDEAWEGSKSLHRQACRVLRCSPDARNIRIHTTNWIIGETYHTLTTKLKMNAAEAQNLIVMFLEGVKASGGTFDRTNAYANRAERVRLSGKAISNNFYDDYGNPEMGDEGVLESVERVEAQLGAKITIVTRDGRFHSELVRRNKQASNVASYVAANSL